MITDVVKPKEIPGAAGLAMIFIGLSQLISNSLGGFLYDETKNCLVPFIVFGSVQTFMGAGLSLLSYYFYRSKK